MEPSRLPLVVCLHDVSPRRARLVRQALDALEPLADRIACAVIPKPGGVPWRPGDASDLAGEVASRSAELLVHGLTHVRAVPDVGRRELPDPLSWLSGRSDELVGLSEAEAAARLAEARDLACELFGKPPRGLVPPAWRQGAARGGLPYRAGFEYVVGLWRVEPRAGAPVALATWSWDWGVLRQAGWAAALPAAVGRARATLAGGPPACPVVAVHPADVERGLLGEAIATIRRLRAEGHVSATFAELAGCCGR